MNKTKIILGGAFILGGYWLIKNFLNKKIEVEKPEINLPEGASDEEKQAWKVQEELLVWDNKYGSCLKQMKGLGGCSSPLDIKYIPTKAFENKDGNFFKLSDAQIKLINEAIEKAKAQNKKI